MPSCHIGVPKFENPSQVPHHGSVLMQDLGGSGNGSEDWITASQRLGISIEASKDVVSGVDPLPDSQTLNSMCPYLFSHGKKACKGFFPRALIPSLIPYLQIPLHGE